MIINPIAHIRTEFPEKFGVPCQSGLAAALRGTIVFTPEYRNPDALRGLEGFSHLWLIWEFSANRDHSGWQPTVRPPRLGGNERIGVFATRSPFRPNPIGLSCVEIQSIQYDHPQGPVIHVNGADLVDGTPIYDIKPYVPSSDCHIDAKGGFSDDYTNYSLEVVFDCDFPINFPEDKKQALKEILSDDPRPAYHNDTREYGMRFDAFNVKFFVEDKKLFVVAIENL